VVLFDSFESHAGAESEHVEAAARAEQIAAVKGALDVINGSDSAKVFAEDARDLASRCSREIGQSDPLMDGCWNFPGRRRILKGRSPLLPGNGQLRSSLRSRWRSIDITGISWHLIPQSDD